MRTYLCFKVFSGDENDTGRVSDARPWLLDISALTRNRQNGRGRFPGEEVCPRFRGQQRPHVPCVQLTSSFFSARRDENHFGSQSNISRFCGRTAGWATRFGGKETMAVFIRPRVAIALRFTDGPPRPPLVNTTLYYTRPLPRRRRVGAFITRRPFHNKS